MYFPNHIVSIKRLSSGNTKDYTNTIITGLRVYIYELGDELDQLNEVDGGQIQKKMLTNYSNIQSGDKITDENNVVYIVKKVKKMESHFKKFYEVMIRQEND